MGYPTKFDVQEEGVPLDRPPSDCFIPLGGWVQYYNITITLLY